MGPELVSESLLPDQASLQRRLMEWAAISSWTYDPTGMARMAAVLETEMASLGVEVQRRELAPEVSLDDQGREHHAKLGPLLVARCRPQAKRQVLLGIHYDTVYGPNLTAGALVQHGEHLRGPGVADAKGGIVVLLAALEAFEQTAAASDLGWELFFNPDEEIGSPCSLEYFESCRDRFDFALLFEPALVDGGMAIQRKGSGNFTFVVRGKSAHAGRDFHEGRNAVVHASRLAERIADCNGQFGTSTFNVARLVGGGPLNAVPDLCTLRVNVRVDVASRQPLIESRLRAIAHEFDSVAGFHCELHGSISSPPKPPTPQVWSLAKRIEAIATPLGQEPTWIETGGVCDGNKLAAVGIPTIDTLGPRGGGLHSEREWVDLTSLVPRARLVASLLNAHARANILE